MGYTVTIINSSTAVTSTVVDNPVNVTVEDLTFDITTTEVAVGLTNVDSTITLYTNAIELLVDDFNNYFMGDWVSGQTYRRGQLVDYAHSLYVCSTGTLTSVTTTVNPAISPAYEWRRVVWHEAPFANLQVDGQSIFGGVVDIQTALDHLTVTNHLSAGSLSVGTVGGTGLNIQGNMNLNGNMYVTGTSTFASTATFLNDIVIGGGVGGNGLQINGPATFNGTATFNSTVNMSTASLTVGRLTASGVLYPLDAGAFGQVLYTNGTNQADWINLGELTLWSLSSDLQTNGFDLVTGYNGSQAQNPRLRIASGNDANLAAYIDFPTGGEKIILNAAEPVEIGNGIKFGDGTTMTSAIPSGYTGSQGPKGDTGLTGGTGATGPTGAQGAMGYTGSQGIQGLPGDVGNLGYTGSRGANGDIGYVGSFGYTGSLGYTGSRGVIGYTGSAAGPATTSTLGSIIVGDGLQVDVNGKVDVIGGGSSAGNISLTQDMETNAYRIKNGTAFLTIDGSATDDIIILQNGTTGDRTPATGPNWLNYTDIIGTSATISTNYWDSFLNKRSAEFKLVSVDDTDNPSDHSYSTLEVYNDDGSAVYPTTTRLNLSFTGTQLTHFDTTATITDLTLYKGQVTVSARDRTDNFNLAPSIKLQVFNDATESVSTKYVLVDKDSVTVKHSAVNITGTTVTITGDEIVLNGPTTLTNVSEFTIATTGTVIIGASEEQSQLNVQKIYNYAGTGAPFFPAGVQYPDSTIQVTAFTTQTLGLYLIDFGTI